MDHKAHIWPCIHIQNLGSSPLCTTSDNDMTKIIGNWVPLKWKYWITLPTTWIELISIPNQLSSNFIGLNFLKIEFKNIEWNSNPLELNSNSIKEKYDANWCRVLKIYSSFTSFMIMVLRKKQLWKDTNIKRHLSIPLKAITNQNIFQ
jgi:hypothetical protein